MKIKEVKEQVSKKQCPKGATVNSHRASDELFLSIKNLANRTCFVYQHFSSFIELKILL